MLEEPTTGRPPLCDSSTPVGYTRSTNATVECLEMQQGSAAQRSSPDLASVHNAAVCKQWAGQQRDTPLETDEELELQEHWPCDVMLQPASPGGSHHLNRHHQTQQPLHAAREQLDSMQYTEQATGVAVLVVCSSSKPASSGAPAAVLQTENVGAQPQVMQDEQQPMALQGSQQAEWQAEAHPVEASQQQACAKQLPAKRDHAGKSVWNAKARPQYYRSEGASFIKPSLQAYMTVTDILQLPEASSGGNASLPVHKMTEGQAIVHGLTQLQQKMQKEKLPWQAERWQLRCKKNTITDSWQYHYKYDSVKCNGLRAAAIAVRQSNALPCKQQHHQTSTQADEIRDAQQMPDETGRQPLAMKSSQSSNQGTAPAGGRHDVKELAGAAGLAQRITHSSAGIVTSQGASSASQQRRQFHQPKWDVFRTVEYIQSLPECQPGTSLPGSGQQTTYAHALVIALGTLKLGLQQRGLPWRPECWTFRCMKLEYDKEGWHTFYNLNGTLFQGHKPAITKFEYLWWRARGMDQQRLQAVGITQPPPPTSTAGNVASGQEAPDMPPPERPGYKTAHYIQSLPECQPGVPIAHTNARKTHAQALVFSLNNLKFWLQQKGLPWNPDWWTFQCSSVPGPPGVFHYDYKLMGKYVHGPRAAAEALKRLLQTAGTAHPPVPASTASHVVTGQASTSVVPDMPCLDARLPVGSGHAPAAAAPGDKVACTENCDISTSALYALAAAAEMQLHTQSSAQPASTTCSLTTMATSSLQDTLSSHVVNSQYGGQHESHLETGAMYIDTVAVREEEHLSELCHGARHGVVMCTVTSNAETLPTTYRESGDGQDMHPGTTVHSSSMHSLTGGLQFVPMQLQLPQCNSTSPGTFNQAMLAMLPKTAVIQQAVCQSAAATAATRSAATAYASGNATEDMADTATAPCAYQDKDH